MILASVGWARFNARTSPKFPERQLQELVILCSASAQRACVKTNRPRTLPRNLNRDHVTKIPRKFWKIKKKGGRKKGNLINSSCPRWKALRSKANPSRRKCFAKQSLSRKLICFVEQSQSIMMERLCEAKPIDHDGIGLALLRKANPAN